MAMTFSSSSPLLSLLFLTTLFSFLFLSHQQPLLNSVEQEAVFQVLSSVNSAVPWRAIYPDDLCLSAPHGVVCDYFTDEQNPTGNAQVHVTELSFGYVSDYTPNPPCDSNATLNPLLFTSFKYLRKLFFYKCFTEKTVSLDNNVSSLLGGFGENLEELVFVENSALVGSLDGIIGNFSNLRRLVLTGNGVYGTVPNGVGDLVNLEEVTLSRNQLSGGVSLNLAKLRKLRVLDLSHNNFKGNVPDSVGYLPQLLKLDLSYNGFSGKIPESLANLQNLEFLDMGFNKFGNFGVPLFLSQMPRLKEVHLSGNPLGGQIPEIWKNLEGIIAIGFSQMGLVGSIPASMGLHLRKLCYLGLDNNNLEGKVPQEFELLESVYELNLENNKLTGKVPFSAKFTAKVGEKLRLKGNSGLCVDGDMRSSSLGKLKLCQNSDNPKSVIFKEEVEEEGYFVSSSATSSVQVLSCYVVGIVGWFLFVLVSYF